MSNYIDTLHCEALTRYNYNQSIMTTWKMLDCMARIEANIIYYSVLFIPSLAFQ